MLGPSENWLPGGARPYKPEGAKAFKEVGAMMNNDWVRRLWVAQKD